MIAVITIDFCKLSQNNWVNLHFGLDWYMILDSIGLIEFHSDYRKWASSLGRCLGLILLSWRKSNINRCLWMMALHLVFMKVFGTAFWSHFQFCQFAFRIQFGGIINCDRMIYFATHYQSAIDNGWTFCCRFENLLLKHPKGTDILHSSHLFSKCCSNRKNQF